MRKLDIEELNRIGVEEFKGAEKIPVIVVLDNVRSLNNIGSVFRTADAFRVQTIYLCGITAKPPHREIHKTALGATESVDWKYFDSTLDAANELKNDGFCVLSIEQVESGKNILTYHPEKNKKYALVFGHEVKGVQQDVINVSDDCLEIPQYGTKHSLNISVCAGIVMWEFFKPNINAIK